MSDLGWFFLFWTFMVALGLLEVLIPHGAGTPARRARWPVNVGFGLVNGAIFSAVPVSLVLLAEWGAATEFGLLTGDWAPLGLAIAATVLGRNLAQYWFHRLMHAVPMLWAVHRVHHCDTHVDGSTGLRFHPVELLANVAFVAPVVLLVGFDPAVLAVYEVVEALIGIGGHTSLRLPRALDRSLRLVFVTPAMHGLHHSDRMSESETNFGTVFSFWDRVFGTYLARSARPRGAFRAGVAGIGRREAARFDWLMTLPLRRRQHGPEPGEPTAASEGEG